MIKISREWAMPNKWTFDIKPVKAILEKYNVGSLWADPFSGKSKLCQYRNDLNNENNQPSSMEAYEFCAKLPDNLNGAVFDPPYSLTQVARSYNKIGLSFKSKENPTGGFPKVRDLLANKIKNGGYCISFGWNSAGLGKKRGFKIIEILIINHGGNRNDTLCTVEIKG